MPHDLSFKLYPVGETPDDVDTLIYEVLYRDWDVPLEPVERWYNREQGGRFVVMRDAKDGTLLGVCRLMPAGTEDPTRVQVRQVVVNPASRGGGLGRCLMEKAAEVAAAEGVTEFWLDAREQAWPFYEKLGYHYTSEVWLSKLTAIPHRTMSKTL